MTSKYAPYVGPSEPGTVHDPRTGETSQLDPLVDTALSNAITLATKMHMNLGKRLFTIGWDVLVVGDTPVFIEFNVNVR